jgi:hypothetical protein
VGDNPGFFLKMIIADGGTWLCKASVLAPSTVLGIFFVTGQAGLPFAGLDFVSFHYLSRTKLLQNKIRNFCRNFLLKKINFDYKRKNSN